MSRLTGTDAYGLMEAYNNVYAPQELTEEQVWEEVETWVNSLLEEGYDLSDYTWEEMYEGYIEEVKDLNLTKGVSKDAQAQLRQRRANIEARGGTLGQIGRVLTRGFGSGEQISKLDAEDKADRRREQTALNRASNPNWKPNTKNTKDVDTKNTKDVDTKNTKDVDTKITTPASPKVAPTKPTPAAQTGDKTKDMATFAKANPTLAASAAERARTRGTSATTNPLMKDMKSRLPAPAAPKVAPSNTLSNTVAAASKPAAFSPTPAVAKTSPTPAAKPTPRQQRLNMEMEYDTFDTVLEHLVSEGYADTNESALVIMANMSEEWRQSILDEGDNYDKNRQRAAKRAAERNAARDAGKTGAVPGVGYVTPRRERETYRDSGGVERHTSGARMPSKDKKDN
jgi:hypothetical protein